MIDTPHLAQWLLKIVSGHHLEMLIVWAICAYPSRYHTTIRCAVDCTLITIALNLYLKAYFQIPLQPHIASFHHWAFPSGHMSAAAAFWLVHRWKSTRRRS